MDPSSRRQTRKILGILSPGGPSSARALRALRALSALALGLPSSFAPLLACHQGEERFLERGLDRGEREEAPPVPGDARRQLGAGVAPGLELDAAARVAVRLREQVDAAHPR